MTIVNTGQWKNLTLKHYQFIRQEQIGDTVHGAQNCCIISEHFKSVNGEGIHCSMKHLSHGFTILLSLLQFQSNLAEKKLAGAGEGFQSSLIHMGLTNLITKYQRNIPDVSCDLLF